MKEIFEKEIKLLFENKSVKSQLDYQVLEIERDFEEYCLTLSFGNIYKITGIKINKDTNIKLHCILNNCSFLIKKQNFKFELYMAEYQIKKDIYEEISNIKSEYNFSSDNIISLFKYLHLFPKEFIEEYLYFIVNKGNNNYTKLIDIITKEEFLIDYSHLKGLKNFRLNKFLYIKNFSKENKTIILNNFSSIQIASDFQVFKLIDKKIEIFNNFNFNQDFYKLKPIEDEYPIEIPYLLSKVVLKTSGENYVIIMDKFKRLFRFKSKLIKDLNLFDLILITNCKIKRSSNSELFYDLTLNNNALFYVSNELIFNKDISINNYTILDIVFPDFNLDGNYYNKIGINEKEFVIKEKREIYMFKFNNEQFNEIIPFNIKCKGLKRENNFKYFITHNILNKINVFINNKNKNLCAKDFCYYNIHNDNDLPDKLSILIDSKNYLISHSNNFDSPNRISFILINVPSDKNTQKIKEKTKKENISSQIWFTASKEKNNKIKYYLTQILDVDEAKPRNYYVYDFKGKGFEIFEDFLFDMLDYKDIWKNEKVKIYEYFDNFTKKVKTIEKDLELLKDKVNIEYDPNSADYYVYKIYAGLSLFQTFAKIKENNNNNFDNTLLEWKLFLNYYSSLLDIINDSNNGFTEHQKMRIISSYIRNYFASYEETRFPCKFWYANSELNSPSNSYLLALNFNKNIIQNLKENSALTIGYLQLDSYILTNYFIEDKMNSYSLSNEPLILMKYHLLINYDNFLFIYSESSSGANANQDNKNRVTSINERCLFDSNRSEYFSGNDCGLVISIEFFHEKDSHSKKSLKNPKIKSPIVCYKNDICGSILLKESEDGRFLESLIGERDFIKALKDPKNKLGELMKLEFFIDKNFEKLHQKFNEIMNKNKSKIIIEPEQNIEEESDSKNNEIKFNESNKKTELVTLEDYERSFLKNGLFIYPDSLPYHECSIDEVPEPLPKGEIEFLNKYKKEIERGKKAHIID